MRALAIGEVHHLRNPFGTALRDDIGRAELDAQVGSRGVAALQKDPLRTELLGGQHAERPTAQSPMTVTVLPGST